MNNYYVLKDEFDGQYLPMAFITPADEAGKIRKGLYEAKKMEEGQKIVLVSLVEITEQN